MERKDFLLALAATAALTLTGCATAFEPAATNRMTPSAPTLTPTPAAPTPSATPTPVPTPPATAAPPPPPPTAPALARVALPGGKIYRLPGDGNRMAWTVDDGSNSAVVAAYAAFARDSGVRLTFFLNGKYPSWADNAPALRPMVESGQVQLGNHTFSHANLKKLSDAGIVDEFQRNDDFIRHTYGVDSAPYYRPPYGYTNHRTEAVASSIGYRAPVMWYGSLSDSGRLPPEQLVGFAAEWFLPEHIVLGHANFDPVTTVYSQLLDIIRQRNLHTVTLADVFHP